MKELLKKPECTEEVHAIIARMPDRFGIYITSFVLLMMIALGIFGWLIRYPDVITGQIVINSSTSPVKLVANTSGKLFLNGFRSQEDVKEGDYIAIILNNARLKDIQEIQQIIRKFKIHETYDMHLFPKEVSLGELNVKYFAFISAYDHFISYHKENLLRKQGEILKILLTEQQKTLDVSTQKLTMSIENVRLMNKFYRRDSILFSNKVLTEAEFDKAQMNTISVKDAYQSMLNNITQNRAQIQETRNKLQQLAIQKNEKEKQIRLDLIAAHTDLTDNFKAWEEKYVFQSPINGKVQFLKFWINNQFIQAGESIFTIVPLKNKKVGQMTLPAFGAGKAKPGQEVIIKLEDYPYTEYGNIKGKVSSISITTNPLKTDKGEIETYLVTVDLPEQLKTNYGFDLDFKSSIKGTGEIVTKDRRLVERLFDNLRYAVNK